MKLKEITMTVLVAPEEEAIILEEMEDLFLNSGASLFRRVPPTVLEVEETHEKIVDFFKHHSLEEE